MVAIFGAIFVISLSILILGFVLMAKLPRTQTWGQVGIGYWITIVCFVQFWAVPLILLVTLKK